MTLPQYRSFIAGTWQDSAEKCTIASPFHGEPVGTYFLADEAQVESAISASVSAFQVFRKSSRYLRSAMLFSMARQMDVRRKELVQIIVQEAGKPLALAEGEVGRAIQTCTLAAEEVKRWGGEVIPVDIEAASRGYGLGVVRWVPRGPIFAITPFNFPLNLIMHKVAPALAAGCSIMVKPPPQAPGTASLLAEIFAAACEEIGDTKEKVPLATLQVFSCTNETAMRVVIDPRITTISFTGSESVGWLLQEKALRKQVVLELGGNAGVIVHEDADLTRAAARCAFGGYAYAGQVCISVQRIFVHAAVAVKFQDLLLDAISQIQVGDPRESGVLVGPLIDRKSADRVMSWIEEALTQGATLLCGGARVGNVIAPTLLTHVKPMLRISCEEVFGPVVVVDTYTDIAEAILAVNQSRFGLQAGVFTNSQKIVQQVTEDLEVGGLLINDVPTYRADHMPYGGVKGSGIGREGVRFAMEHFSERKTIMTWSGL